MDPNGSSPYFFNPSRCTKIKLYIQATLILIIFILGLPILIGATLYHYLVSKLGPLLCTRLTHILPLHASPRYLNQGLVDEICCNIVVRFKIRGTLNFEILKARIAQRFVLAKNAHGQLRRPELQQYPFRWAGYDFWKWESEFNIDEHVVHQTNNSEVPFTYTELDQLELQFLKASLERDKSPWKIIIVDNIEQSTGQPLEEPLVPCFLVWLKIHHSLCDGGSLFNALMECADEKVPALEHPTLPRLRFLPRVLGCITFPFRVSYEYARVTQEKSGPSPWPLVPIDQTSGRCRERYIVRSNYMDKTRIKKLALQNGSSFTAIVLAAITGGMRNFLLQSNNSAWRIPQCINAEVPVPVESHPEGLTNVICAVTLTLPIGCPDICQRIAICEQSVADRKASTEPKLTYFLYNLQGIFGRLFTVPYKFPDVAFGIFPGPLQPVTFCGQELFEMSYAILAVPLPLGLTLLTYGDGLQFYCTGDDRLLTQHDVQQLVQCMEDEVDKMEKEIAKGVDRKLNKHAFEF